MELLGIELDFEEFDRLMCEQNNGKELKVENGKVVAFERIPTIEEETINEYNTLINWFNIEYTKLEQKYRRLHTLKIYCDDGRHPYDALLDLYELAERKRRRIQELEVLINE